MRQPSSHPIMDFQLRRSPRGDTWFARVLDGKLGLEVAGGDDAPHPAHLATLRDLTDRWAEVQATLAAYLRALPPDHPVLFELRPDECFRASICGFDGELFYQALTVTDPTDPTHAELTFYTGFPDGYATYTATLEAGRPVKVTTFAS